MIRQKILQQLLEWIECNLDHPISIEDIAQKSGYSRRNIQLLFRNFMHMPLGSYIRKRRLCRAAILVRLTAKSMLDIALSLHFDSQQSFSREFKKLFGCSPREYRLRDFWDLTNILPPLLTRQYQNIGFTCSIRCYLIPRLTAHSLRQSQRYSLILQRVTIGIRYGQSNLVGRLSISQLVINIH